jgi:hypothetical protein
MAKKLSNSPVVQGVQLPPETLARMPYGEGKGALCCYVRNLWLLCASVRNLVA